MSDLILQTPRFIHASNSPEPNSSILIRDGVIEAIGPLDSLIRDDSDCARKTLHIDASNWGVLPGFVDAHTHLVFSGSREDEFYMRASNRSYMDIMQRGGGIHKSVRSLHQASEEELIKRGLYYLDQVLRFGTTTVEIKTGYGLNFQQEEKMLRVINKLDSLHPVDIIPTFLVHALPRDLPREKAMQTVLQEMIPAFRSYAEWFDIFVEKNVFSLAEAESLVGRAHQSGYHIGLHTNQVHDVGGISMAIDMGARHVDHLEVLRPEDASRIIDTPELYSVFLPSAEYHVFSERVGHIRELLSIPDRLVLSTDFNPGSSPVLAPPVIMSLAVLRYRLSDPDLLIHAFTRNPADLFYLQDRGRIAPGQKADLVCVELDNAHQVPYWGTLDIVAATVKSGTLYRFHHDRPGALIRDSLP
jgi:imidazolonepropionase